MNEPRMSLTPQLAQRVRQLSDETLVIVLEAFREGRQAGQARIQKELGAYVGQLLTELETAFGQVEREGVDRVEESYAGAKPSPVVAAHFGGAGDVLHRVRGRIDELARER